LAPATRPVASWGSNPCNSCSNSLNAGSLSPPTSDSTGAVMRLVSRPELPSLQLWNLDAEERVCVPHRLLPTLWDYPVQEFALAWREDGSQKSVNRASTVALPVFLKPHRNAPG
jgi:hypothetical protein